MNFYVAALLLYLIIIPLVIVSSVGLWAICAKGWRAYNDCKVGASTTWTTASANNPGPRIQRSHSRASCVGRTGGSLPDNQEGRYEGRDTFPREWVLARTGPYNQEDDAA